jgi:propanol-preferring alcohol dehydrogenase
MVITMKAMVLNKIAPVNKNSLDLMDVPIPVPGKGEILVKIVACGVCHTELDEIEGRLMPPKLPVILGHEIVSLVEKVGPEANKYQKGDRVGIAWIHWACGKCDFCKERNENLCSQAKWTGFTADGGYAQYTVVDENFAYPIPEIFSDIQAAPLLCAGVIGYRALRLTGMRDHQILGLFGFGASAHLVIQMVRYQYTNSKIFVFTRPGQVEHQMMAEKLGAAWVGNTGEMPPEPLHYAIDFTPVGTPVGEALKVLAKGGRLVINAIRKEEPIPALDYSTQLWQEKEIKSVANVTRRDAEEFLPLAAKIPIVPKVTEFRLEEANEALLLLKKGEMQGAGVLII